jgi:hypothetical protein
LFKEDDYCNLELALNCSSGKTSFDEKEYICRSCKDTLRKGDMPALSVFNNLKLDDIPQELKTLNALEIAIIAKRIQFMKLPALPRGKQKCVHGTVVNIPVEPQETVSILPRVPSSAAMVMVKLKRKVMCMNKYSSPEDY